jgi:hypothetical protein
MEPSMTGPRRETAGHHRPQVHNWHRAAEHREYVRRLLSERQPEFFAVLQAAERQLDLELSNDSQRLP